MKASIKPVLLLHKKLKNGNYPVFLRVTVERKIKYFSLGSDYNCAKNEWYKKDGCFKPDFKDAKQMNEHIDETVQKARKTAIQLEQTNSNYTVEDFYLAYTRKGNSIMVLEYFDEIVKGFDDNGDIGNADIYKQTKNRIKAYLKTKNINTDISLASINVNFLNNWVKFLRKTCGDTTIHLRLRTLRALINMAKANEGFDYYVFKDFKLTPFSTKTPKRALKLEEMKAIFNYKADPSESKYHSLNYFKFMYLCWGMNWVDVCHLKKDQIEEDKFTYIRIKTGKHYTINIIEATQKIIDEYKEYNLNSPYVFPILNERHIKPRTIKNRVKKSLDNVNEDIQSIAKELKIEKEVTTYTTRHTFATILKYLNVPTEVISEIYGHSSINTTNIYLDSFKEETLNESTKKATDAIIY